MIFLWQNHLYQTKWSRETFVKGRFGLYRPIEEANCSLLEKNTPNVMKNAKKQDLATLSFPRLGFRQRKKTATECVVIDDDKDKEGQFK